MNCFSERCTHTKWYLVQRTLSLAKWKQETSKTPRCYISNGTLCGAARFLSFFASAASLAHSWAECTTCDNIVRTEERVPTWAASSPFNHTDLRCRSFCVNLLSTKVAVFSLLAVVLAKPDRPFVLSPRFGQVRVSIMLIFVCCFSA